MLKALLLTVCLKLFICLPVQAAPTYHFERHNQFVVFWKDFKAAVISGDRAAVVKMTNFPFQDQYQEIYFKAYGGKKSLNASTGKEFLENYQNVFVPNVLTAVKENHFRPASKSKSENMGLGQAYFKSGLYILEVADFNKRGYNLAFGKKGGVYKLCYIPYYE